MLWCKTTMCHSVLNVCSVNSADWCRETGHRRVFIFGVLTSVQLAHYAKCHIYVNVPEYGQRDTSVFRCCLNTGNDADVWRAQLACTHAYIRKKFFTDRVINVWNSLPSTVNFTSVMDFRRSLNNVDFGSHIYCRLEVGFFVLCALCICCV